MRSPALLLALCACGARTELAGTQLDASDAPSSGCHDEIIAMDAKGASALALDGDVVLWGTQDGLVRMRDASGTKTLATEADTISSIAVGSVDPENVYYAIIGRVRRVPRAGGPAEDVATNVGIPFALSFASDGALDYLDYGAGIAAGSAQQIRNLARFTLIPGLDTPGGLAVDAQGNVYATAALALIDQQTYMGPLIRVDELGNNRVALATGLHDPKSITAYGGRLYFIEQTDAQSTLHGGVRSIDENGGAPTIEIATDGFLPIDVAADASGVYATAFSKPESVLFHGASVIAKTPNAFYEAVRTSATAVYWTIGWTSTPPADGASVRKLCK